MTYIIKNIYTCNSSQSIFTRFLGTVVLAFILLIGGSGSAWAQTVVATWDWKTNSQIDGFSAVEGNTCTIASDQTGISLDIDATSGKVWDNGDNIGVNSGTIISVPVQSVNDVVVVRNYSGYTNYQVGEQGPANDLVIHFVTSDEAEAGKVDITVTSQVYLYTIMVAQKTVSNGSYTAAWNWNQASNVISGSLSKTVQGNVDFEESDVAGVALTVDATGSDQKVQYANNGTGYIQFNTGTAIYVPVKCAGDVITINAYPGNAGYKIGDGSPVSNDEEVYTVTASDASNGYVKITATNNKYLCGITLKHFEFKDFALNMYNGNPFFTNTPTSNPYYVTVNESGVASYATTEPAFYNAKMTFGGYNGDQHGYANMVANIPVVPGKYDITIGNCKHTGPYLVKNGETLLATINANANCYAGTAETATTETITIDSPMTLTIVNNGSKATYTPYFAICRVVETAEPAPVIPEKISSFELDFTGTGNAYDIVKDKSTTGSASVFGISIDENGNPVETSTNPHISFNTYYKNSTYGLWFANTGQSMSFDVYGPVKITLGMTDYNSDIVITDSKNTELTTISLNNNNAKFTSSTGEPVVSYNYTGGATRLTLKCKQNEIYIPYIKVEEIDAPIVDDGIPVPSGLYDVVVSNVDELKAALATGGTSSDRKTIFVKNGTYELGTDINTQVRDYTTIVGQSRDGVIIQNHPATEGIWSSATLRTGSNVIMQNLTLHSIVEYNSTTDAERGTALYDEGSNNVYKNIRLLGRQDTYYSDNNASSYFEGCEIHGTVDFICGSGNVWFEKCALLIESSTVAYITAARRYNTPGTYNGYIFNECTIDNAEGADMAGKYYLGRAWDDKAKVSYYKTTKNIAPRGEKWTAMTGGGHVVSVDVDNSPANIVASPVSYLPAPAGISVQNEIITWTSVDGASAYAVFDGNNIIAIVGSDVLSYDTSSPFTAKSVAGYNSFGTEDRYSVAAIGTDGLIGNLVTDKEIASLGSEFYYDFRDQDFDFDDHELIDRIGDNSEYHDNQHGWKFNADSGFSIEVAGNATIYVSRCTFGSGSPRFTITSDNGGTISPNTFDARSDYAGGMAVINYVGPATTLRFVTDGESYVHTVRVINEGAVAVAFADTKDKATIKNNVVGATVYYTLDGSTPTTTNYKERFTGAYSEVPVKDCWVKAISVKDGVVIDMEEKFCRSTFAGFSWDFSNGNTLLGNYGQNNKFETGVIIDDRGDTHLVPVGDMSSSIDISTAYHDASHGYVGFHARVPVEGPVTITIGNCQYGNGKVTISAENGQKWDLYPSEAGNCYHENKESNFVRFEYTGDATILTIASENDKTVYLPYISVRDASASKVKFVNRYPKTLLGTAPNEVEVNEAHQAFIPYNTTLYREGWAVTGWEDSETGTQYDLGRNYTFYQNTTLYPVLTKSTKAITDTDHELTVTWPFDKLDGAPTIKLHDYTSDPFTMTYVKGVNVEGAMVDVPLVIDATSSKAVNTDERINELSGNGAQFNDNTVLRIPAVYGMTVTLNASDKNDGFYHTSTSFTGDNHAVVKLREEDATVLSNQGTVTNNGKTITFTYEGESPTLDIIVEKAGSGATWGFFTDLSVTYPVLPNVVTTNVITNADAETYPNENPENAGEVTVTLTSEGASHVNTGTRFREGDVVTLEATPGYGYTFAGFRKRVEGGAPVAISGNEFTVPEEGGITTIEVLFTRKDLIKVTATSDDVTKGDVSISPKYSNLYNELENGVVAYFEAGTEVSVSAEAEREYVIDKWVDGETETTGKNIYKFTLTSEKNIVAHFKPGAMGTVVFNIEGSGVHNVPDPDTFNNAVSIAPETQSGVRSFYIPYNYTFFKNQYTLMYWTDGTRRYELGKYYSFDYEGQEIVLTPVFEHNIADKENRVRGDELYWDFLTMNQVQEIHWDTPNLNFFWTSKVDVEVIEDGVRRDHTRDVALWIHTNAYGFMRNDDLPDWAAFGPGTTIDLPSCAGATIKIYSYSEITSTTIDDHIPVLDELETRKIREDGEHGYVYTYTTSNPNPRVTIAIGDDFSYYKWIRCYSLPAALLELHMDVDNSVRGEIVEIKGSGEYEATELADGGFAFQQGNRVHATFKRKFGYDFDRIIDVNRFTETGDPLPVLQVQRTDGVITGVRMVVKNSDEFEDAVKQPDGSWKGSAFTFTEMPVAEGELDTYEVQFEISSHRTIEVCFLPRPTHYITFSTGEFASGVAPEPLWVEEGDKFTIPYNKTLYYDNHTLKAWRDENNNMYSLGGEYRAPDTDLRLYPVFVENIFSVLDVTEDTKVTWNLTKNGGAPTISYERSSGILVTQLWKDDDFIDMKIDLNASEVYKDGALWVVNGNVVAGKFDNTSYDDRCQINEHSTITFPAIKDCVIELEALSPIPTSVKISGSEHAEAAKISHTYVLGWTQHSVEFEDDGNNGNVYNTWCTALSITYKPITANMPELASVTYGSTTLTAVQLASLKQNFEIDVPFNVGENDEFPNVTATAENGTISVAQASIDNHTAIVYLVSYGGITIDSYYLNFNPVIETSPMLVGSPSIYVNSTGYNSEVIPLDQPIDGTISLSFNRTMQAVDRSTGIRLYNEGVAQGDALTALQGSTLVLRYWNLEVNKEYTLTIPGNTLQDVYGGKYDSDISVTFRTASEIVPVEHRKFNWIVGVDGTLSEGINAANNASGLGRFYIFVPDGEYELEGNETIVPTAADDASTLYDGDGRRRDDLIGTTLDNNKTRISRANVSLIGQSEMGTKIYNRPVIEGIGYTATLHLPSSATDFYAQDLTLENRFNYHKAMSASQNNAARAVVLQGHGSRAILKNVSMWSYQDTYYTSNSETDPHFCAYLEDCSIAGVVDWISGGGNVWFEKCNIIHRDRAGNNIAAPHTNRDQRWGFVFNDCVITTESDPESMQNMGEKDWTLARPWGVDPNQSPACTFLNTTVTALPRDAGWGAMYGGMVLRFHEYKTKDADGNLVSLGRRSLAACAPAAGSDDYLLTNAEASEYEVDEVLEFDPALYTAQREAVTNISIEGGVLKWKASADGMDLCYFIFKKDSDGKWKYFANVADTNLDFNLYGEDMREGFYMIRAANQRGGLGAYSEEIEYKEAEMFELTISEIGQTPGKGWSTICLPNNARVPEGDIKVYAAVSIDENIVTLKRVDYITANIGYVVYGAVDTYVFYGSTHKATDTEGYNYSHDSYLSGNPSDMRVSAATTNCYTLAYKPAISGIGFYRYSGTWLNPHKAYLDVEDFKRFNSSTADEDDTLSKSFAKGIRFVFAPEENTTDIPLLDLNAIVNYKTDAIYDLSGRRVVTPHSGQVYIINGSKAVRK